MSKISRFFSAIRPKANINWFLSAILIILFLTYVGFGVYFGLQVYKYKANKIIEKRFIFIETPIKINVTALSTHIYPFPAAMVNGKVVWAWDYYRQWNYIQNLNEKSKEVAEEPAVTREKIINLLVKNEIIEYQALRYNIRVTNGEVNDAYEQLAAGVGGTDNVKKTLLDMYQMSERDFKKMVREIVQEEKVRSEVIAQVKVDHIFVKDEARAKEIVEKLKNGEDFAALAKQYSEDTKSRDNGGDIGWVAKGQLVLADNPIPEFDNAAFSAKIGEIIGPIKISGGFEIFKVEAKKGSVQEKFDDWLEGLKKKATIWRFIKS